MKIELKLEIPDNATVQEILPLLEHIREFLVDNRKSVKMRQGIIELPNNTRDIIFSFITEGVLKSQVQH